MVIGIHQQEQIVKQIEGSPRGVSSVYVRLDGGWGLKLFYDEDDRNFAYNLQSQAAKYGLGPEVGEKIDLSVDCVRPYGYVTEHVRVLPHKLPTDNSYSMINRNYNFQENRLKLLVSLNDIFGADFGDLHPFNIGWKNGKYICIDFGIEGVFYDEDNNKSY